MSVKERLICFLKHINLSQAKFEKNCELSNGYINNIRVSIQPKTLDKIIAKYPELNASWLLIGEGEMIKDSSSCDKQQKHTEADKIKIIAIQEKIIAMYEEKIKRLESDIKRYEKELQEIRTT